MAQKKNKQKKIKKLEDQQLKHIKNLKMVNNIQGRIDIIKRKIEK